MPEATSNDHGVFEIIGTTRSMRRLKPDPVPDALIRKILEAAVCAPSGGNMQRWGFLVITDLKEEVAVYYRRAWEEHVRPGYQSGPPAPGSSPERFGRMLDAAQYLSEPSSRSSGMDHRLPHNRGQRLGEQPVLVGIVNLSRSAEHAAGGARPRPGRDVDHVDFALRGRSQKHARPAARCAALCAAAYRLADGPLRTSSPLSRQCGVRRQVGRTLPRVGFGLRPEGF